ncbi:MAG: RDD family protein [Candidatus Riflebacteria bacterium]|nr:RDD family protein [Candidatus Riflebacteria bacterium]
MKSQIRSQNLSILLTDLQGYTNTSSASSREEIIGLIRRHNQLMTPVIEFYGGTIIKGIGDALLCTFQSATDAVVCSIIIQLLLKEYNTRQKDSAKRMNLRVVINTGDVSIEANDIFGEAVNITARMEALPCFPGGTIGISEATYLLMNKSEIIAEKIGPQTLKGIPEPVTVFQVPLAKQKLTSIPTKLLQLVETIVEGKTPSGATVKLTEWTSAVKGFLSEKNWGENIQQIGKKVNYIQDQISKSLTQKNASEFKKDSNEISDAPVMKRLVGFAIDMVIIAFFCATLSFSWWASQRVIYGKSSISNEEFSKLGFGQYKNFHFEYDSDGHGYYLRNMGFTESFINLNAKFPIIPIFLYFFLFWSLKGASPGQIFTKTRLVDESGKDINFSAGVKRSAFFMISTFFLLGIGGITIFFGDRKTIYDKLSHTRVVE